MGLLSQHMSKPGKRYWVGVKRVLRYIKGTLDDDMQYKATNADGVMNSLRGYADADCTGDKTTQKSISIYMFQIGSCTVSWDQSVSRLSLFHQLRLNMWLYLTQKQSAIWLQILLNGMIFDQEKSTTMSEDNEGTIELVKNPSYYLQTKYNDINFHHTPDAVATKKIHLQYCPAQEVIADLLTKGLSRPHTVHL